MGSSRWTRARSGKTKIIAEAKGYLPHGESKDLKSDTPLSLGNISLTGSKELEGTVIDQDSGKPITGEDSEIPGTILRTKSDDTGRYHFAGMPPSPVELVVSAQDMLQLVSAKT